MITQISVLIYVISLFVIVVNVNKFMHIFQQSFYEVDEFFPAIKTTKSLRIKVYNILLVILAVASFFLPYTSLIYAAISIFTAYKTINRRPVVKKKFVYTTRVKITYTIIAAILIASICGVWYMNAKYLPIVLLILSLYKTVAIALMIIGNILAQPILKLSNRKYIKEAKDIMKSNSKMKVIGITGSYGKTSTKNIVTSLLEQKYITVMTPKSYNTTLGVVRTIREQIKPYTEVFVCEMGAARLGEIKEICDIATPDISVITSIGPQHLTSFKSMDNIIKGKFEILTNAKEKNTAVLNIDNDYINKGIELYGENKNIITFSLNDKENSKYHVENINMSDKGSIFDVVSQDSKITVETKLLGKHNIANIVCAIAIARELGMTNEEIKKGIKKIKPVEHRLELKNMGGILALDDAFNSNPEGSKAAIETLLMFKDKYKVLVTPGMIELGDKTDELNEKFGEYASDLDYVILVGKVTTMAIEKGLNNKGFKNYIIVNDIYEAFGKLQELQISHENLLALFENDLPDSYINNK